MDFEELLLRVALSFGIGLLIGLERGWHTREARPGSRTAGVRTFAISGLTGGIVGALARGVSSPVGELTTAGSILLGSSFLAYAVVMAAFSRDENRATGTFSATTTIAALLTFLLGTYALFGDVRVAAAAAVATTGILIVREALHGWVAKITLAEFESGLVLLAMTCIALPMLPDRTVGPFGGINVRAVWLTAIVLAVVSFAGYVSVKLLGERRGSLLAAAMGGLVSSTAVTLASARRAAAGEGSPRILAGGAILATAISFARVAAIVWALQPGLVSLVLPALLVAASVAAALAIASVRLAAPRDAPQPVIALRNPFGFWYVVGAAASIGVLIMIGRLLYDQFGAGGAIAGAGTMGLFDVDAMTVSMTRLVPQRLDASTATYAILVGVAANTVSKAFIAAVIGRRSFAIRIAAASLVSIAAGYGTLWLTLTWQGP